MAVSHKPMSAGIPSPTKNPSADEPEPESQPPAVPLPATYEEAVAELERLVASMEAGQLPLDRLLGGYRRGAELLAFCKGRLDAVESQVQILEEGQLKPWNE
jgi:exodeoxyribonuclease VII small subunit